MRVIYAILALCLFTSGVLPASAQDHDARAHFRRGIEHFNDGNHDAALAEFQRAYAIAPAHQVLFNIARVYAAQGNAVEAAAAYQRYLEAGGSQIDAGRRAEVERALEVQQARIGRLDLEVSVDGATIAVDGSDVAVSPLEAPLEVTAGTVELEVRASGHEIVRRRLRVAGGVVERLVIDLVEGVTPGILRIESHVPDVLVEIDGEAVGRTPFDSTVTLQIGEHRLVARRRGYRTFERTLHIDRGAEAEVVLEMERDEFASDETTGEIVLSLPDAPYQVRIDGEPAGVSALAAVPEGRHRLELDVSERLPYSEVIDVRGGERTELAPQLEWTPAARHDRQSGASFRRWLGIGLTIGGVLLGAAGLSLYLWNKSEIDETNLQLIVAQEMVVRTCPGQPDMCMMWNARGLELNSERDGQSVVEGVSLTMAIAGGVSTVVGVLLWATAPSEEAIDEAAHAEFDIVPVEGGAVLSARLGLP